MRRGRPELLIGRPGERLSEDNLEWGIRTGLNFAEPEARPDRHNPVPVNLKFTGLTQNLGQL